MNSLIIFFIIFFILMAIVHSISLKYKFIDKQEYSNNKKNQIPLIGGFFIIIPLSYLVITFNNEINYYFIFSIYLIFLVGFYDDYTRLSVRFRLFTQFVSAILIVSSGYIITQIILGQTNLNFYGLSYLITIIFILFYINAFNFIDGHDGICSTVSLVFFIPSFFILEFSSELDKNIFLFLIISLTSFTILNLGIIKKFKIFLGDSGSTTLGLIISYFIIKYGFIEKSENYIISLLLWFSFIPIMDSANVILVRIRKFKSPFSGDKNHIHHILTSNKISKKQTYFIIISLSVFLAIFGYYFSRNFSLLYNFILMLLFFFIYHFLFYYKTVNKLK